MDDAIICIGALVELEEKLKSFKTEWGRTEDEVLVGIKF